MVKIGAPIGTTTTCDGCGITFTRRLVAQRYHDEDCRRRNTSWRTTAFRRKAPRVQGQGGGS